MARACSASASAASARPPAELELRAAQQQDGEHVPVLETLGEGDGAVVGGASGGVGPAGAFQQGPLRRQNRIVHVPCGEEPHPRLELGQGAGRSGHVAELHQHEVAKKQRQGEGVLVAGAPRLSVAASKITDPWTKLRGGLLAGRQHREGGRCAGEVGWPKRNRIQLAARRLDPPPAR